MREGSVPCAVMVDLAEVSYGGQGASQMRAVLIWRISIFQVGQCYHSVLHGDRTREYR